jgi:putative phosphoesterase
MISDLHGNTYALNAVMKDIKKSGIDQTICLGDLATLGADPSGAIAIMRDNKIPCIMGNHDEFMLTPEKVKIYTKYQPVIDAVYWCYDVLSKADKDFIATLKDTISITCGKYKVGIYHASPFSNSEDVFPSTSTFRLDRMLEGRDVSAMVFGHTHMQMYMTHQGVRIFNPGSVGAPFKTPPINGVPVILPVAQYGVVHCGEHEMYMELRTLELDRKGLAAFNLASNYPLREQTISLWPPA